MKIRFHRQRFYHGSLYGWLLGLMVAACAQAQPLQWAWSPAVHTQGSVLVLRLAGQADTQLQGVWALGKAMRFYQDASGARAESGSGLSAWVVYVPLPADCKAGHYAVKVRWSDASGGQEDRREFSVVQRHFPSQTIRLPSARTKALVKDNQALDEEASILGALFRRSDPQRYFFGPFVNPAQGPISSEFGARRVYDDGRIGWMHKGADIAAGEGLLERLCPSAGEAP